MTSRDYYEILGISRNADQQEIKSAYRKLAVRYHPDKNAGNQEAEERFKEAAEAYSVLSDPEKRTRYNQFGHAGVSPGTGGFDPEVFSDFSDVLGDFFGFGDLFGHPDRRRHQQQRGADLLYHLKISFDEAVSGVSTKIKIPRMENCGTCNGSRADPDMGLANCSACNGRGSVRYQQGFFTISRTCSSCHGTGQIVRSPCSACSGKGQLRKEKVLEIRIPPGVDEGSRLRVTREGEAGATGGPPGDLYVVISVEEHPFFIRQDNHVYCEVPITFHQAALGAQIAVPTLGGDQDKIKMPAGTQPEAMFRLRGRGISSLNGTGKGDQLVRVKVVTPTRLTSEQRELFERLAEISGDEPTGGLFKKFKEMLS